jgi:hypothetical protein
MFKKNKTEAKNGYIDQSDDRVPDTEHVTRIKCDVYLNRYWHHNQVFPLDTQRTHSVSWTQAVARPS